MPPPLLQDGLDTLLPPLCVICGDGARRHGLCAACTDDLPWNRLCCPRCALPQLHAAPCADCAKNPPPYDRAWCPLRLETSAHWAIHGLKYRAQFLHAHILGRLMSQTLAARSAPLPQLLIPVPLHPSRLRWRGYNQALELARAMTETLALPIDAHACRRQRRTADQIGMSAAQRRRNVRGAFAATRSLQGLRVAILDDVMTTGATLGELARVCRKAGAATVEVWAAARVA